MASKKNGIMVYFSKDEAEDIKKACEAYELGQSEFLGLIIRWWLFNHRLELDKLKQEQTIEET